MSDLGWKYLTSADKQQILRGIADGRAYGGPYHVELYPADRCNIECFFCSTAAIRGTDELPLSRLEELIGELKQCGTRAVRLSGGGEPLFHRRIADFLDAIEASGIPIENLTTNAVLMNATIAEKLVRTCDHVTVSLNTADEASYATMMKTPARNFHRVLDNIRTLIETRDRLSSRRPHVAIQFLPWKETYKTIPDMYRLARELRVDSIIFNGIGWMTPEQFMTPEETDEMMRLYETIVRQDEYRTIKVINSFEQDLSGRLTEMNERLVAERTETPAYRRLWRLLTRRDFTFMQKLRHHRDNATQRSVTAASEGMEQFCLIGWHSMVIRSSGEVAPCCILQGKNLGNIYRQSVQDVWHGEGYDRFRRELSEIMNRGDRWTHDSSRHETVDSLCGKKGACPMASFWYQNDVPFLTQYNRDLANSRQNVLP